jgi:triosephosphate isomerase (TIM)
MRKTIIAGNWKMYKTISEALELVNGLKREVYSLPDGVCECVVCPPFTALSEVSELLAETVISLGAQNCHWMEEGAFTGEVSCKMLKDAGCAYVIIGHSERRQYFGETNETVNKKIRSVLAAGLTPILCIGETLQQREAGKTFDVIKDHLEGGLQGIAAEEMEKIVVAYEPVWAIGTGKTATSAQAQEVHHYARELLAGRYSRKCADAVRIQYGGSVKPENITELIQQKDIDGALVGGASLTVSSFAQIVKKASEVSK